jgi:aspartokinase-like uncharacterized kinase
MRASARGLTVVKLGGSHAFSAHLTDWLRALSDCAGKIVVVPGGGPFADTVRAAQAVMRFDDAAAHRMALLAMEQYGHALACLAGDWTVAASAAAIGRAVRDGRVPVWLPTAMALADRGLPCSWDLTSDSLAAWLAGRIGARRLLLIKHRAPKSDCVAAEDLAADGLIDPLFVDALRASGAEAYWAGPTEHAACAAAVRDGSPPGCAIAVA